MSTFFSFFFLYGLAASSRNNSMAWSFQDVPITKDIQYIPCFENYTCTNIEVPLDYDNRKVGTTNIAFVKLAASNQPAIGDIIYNPGGPGGSAVGGLFEIGSRLVALLGDSHNIVAMDPRGVNNSGPLIDCFNGDSVARKFFYSNILYATDPRSPGDLSKFYNLSGAWGTWCSHNLNKTIKYVNTPATAADMLHYAELLAEGQGRPREVALVNYYGVSYGTTLGTTFASMFPTRVGKFLIDGVVDGEDYYTGNWSQNILMADKAVDAFFESCAKAGPACALYRNGSSKASIKKRTDAILEDLERNPIPVADSKVVQFPTVITHIDARLAIMSSLYNPIASWPGLAQLLVSLEARVGSVLAKTLVKGQIPTPDTLSVPDERTAMLVISCNDNNHSFNTSERALVDLFEFNRNTSSYIGEVWAAAIVPVCRNLNTTPPANQLFPGYKQIKTQTRILFVNNAIDAITSSFEKMSGYFNDSVVLLQDAVGHGVTSTVSKCTSSYVQQYLEIGRLPPPGIVCEADLVPFA